MLGVIVIPRERGGWWHHYVCPIHGTELDTDRERMGLLGGAFPEGGVACRHGCRWDTPAIRGAWTVIAHQACARAADEPVLREYEKLYLSLSERNEQAQPWMLRGRLFQQALTEAIWAVSIGQAAWRLGNPVPALLSALAEAAEQARGTLLGQGRHTSNFTAWLNAAGAVCSREEKWQRWQQEHVLAATLDDGWEWEATSYYHRFVLTAYEASLIDPPTEVARRLERMREIAAVFGDTALHDSPYVPAGHVPGPHASCPVPFTAPPPARPVRAVYPDAGYAVTDADGIRAIVDFGPHGGGHGHRDKLSLYLYPWQPDPGQVLYGHKAWREHYASTRAHPTFRIDDLEQAQCSGRQVGEDTFACDTAYEGVSARRRVVPVGGGLLDELTVTCDRPRTVTLQLRPAVPLEAGLTGESVWTTRWLGRPVLLGRHECDAMSEFRVAPGPGPADDPQRMVRHVDWTAHGVTSVTFRSEYRTRP